MATAVRKFIRRALESSVSKFYARKNKNFFFVRGFQKSGTNWVKNLLNLHPLVLCRGEYHFERIAAGIDSFLKLELNKENVDLTVDYFESFVRACLKANNHAHGKGMAEWFGDCTPGPIKPIYLRGAKTIYILRDGRDILVSQIYHRLRNISLGNLSGEFKNVLKSFPLLYRKVELFKQDPDYFENNPGQLLDDEIYVRDFAKRWTMFVQSNMNLMAGKGSGLDRGTVLCVKYEDLHADVITKRNEIYEFLNLDSKQANDLGKWCTPGFGRTDNRSFFRKGVVGDWKKYFGGNVRRWFKEEAGHALMELGYEQNLEW